MPLFIIILSSTYVYNGAIVKAFGPFKSLNEAEKFFMTVPDDCPAGTVETIATPE